MAQASITALFLDIGGVILNNGWDHEDREKAAKAFNLDLSDMESRHRQTFDTFEIGKISLREYLNRVIFYKTRSFTANDFEKFMFEQSRELDGMIGLFNLLKKKYNLKIAAVSNEGRELNAYRIQKFNLRNFIDFFISSCYVHLRKPDEDIFRMALDVAQVPVDQALYIEDRTMFVQVAQNLGIKGIMHADYASTKEKLASFGLHAKE